MTVISENVTIPTATGLNPNAPMFVPAAYKAVEDFSEEWWALVHSSPWFQDYWLQYKFQDPQITPLFPDFDNQLLFELDSLFDDHHEKDKVKGEKDYNKDLITLGALKWRNLRGLAKTPKFAEKAPKIVNKKMIPKPIQQPR